MLQVTETLLPTWWERLLELVGFIWVLDLQGRETAGSSSLELHLTGLWVALDSDSYT